MHQTNVDRALAALEEKFADDPERSSLVRLTRRFKASWLELAEALSDARRGKSWERWGYDSFDAYTRGELKLKPETVEKLTGSFMFLHKRAPEVLKRDPIDAPLPSYQAIDFLRRAEEVEDVSEETMSDIRRKILDEGAPMATVARLYKDTLFPVPEEQKKEKDRHAIKSAATKLRDLLAETNAVPRKVATDTAETLERLLEHLGAEAKAA
ncbi:MAG TPA: hypothetical protein VIF62_16380 [Labilithrix sp.]|jgi:hypothetical protein